MRCPVLVGVRRPATPRSKRSRASTEPRRALRRTNSLLGSQTQRKSWLPTIACRQKARTRRARWRLAGGSTISRTASPKPGLGRYPPWNPASPGTLAVRPDPFRVSWSDAQRGRRVARRAPTLIPNHLENPSFDGWASLTEPVASSVIRWRKLILRRTTDPGDFVGWHRIERREERSRAGGGRWRIRRSTWRSLAAAWEAWRPRRWPNVEGFG